MATLIRDGGFPMFFLLAFGLAALAFAVRFATAPSQRSLRTALALSAATAFTALTGICTALAKVGQHAPDFPKSTLAEVVLIGIGESLSAGILGGTMLSLIALIIALGVWRQQPASSATVQACYPCGMAGPIQLIDDALLDETLERASRAPRGRTNHNFHPDMASNPHRFLNAWTRGSYGAPHRHLAVPKPESFVVLRGEMALFIFDDQGRVTGRHVLGRAGLVGIDVAPGIWHTVACVSETAICFEVKAGPYEVSTDKEFAPWAPREGDPEAAAYLEQLLAGL